MVPSSVLAPKLWFFWDPSVFWEHFGAKPCQKHGGSPKKQSFGAKALEGTKTTKDKVLEHCVVWQLKTPKLCFFVFLVPSSDLAPNLCCFGDPPCFWQGFTPKCSQNTEGSQKKPSAEYHKNPKNKVLEHWVVWQLKTPELCFFDFFWYPPAFWHQNFVVLGTLHGFGKVLLQNAPKPLGGPKNHNQATGSENLRICDSVILRVCELANC